MSWIKRVLRPIARTSPVRQTRRAVGRVGAPGLNPEIEYLHRRLDEIHHINSRLDELEHGGRRWDPGLQDLRRRLDTFDRHMPGVLNAVASTNGTARLLRREFDALGERLTNDTGRLDAGMAHLGADVERLSSDIVRIDGHIRDDLWPLQSKAAGLDGLYETSVWLVNRVETVRAEMMHELRYGAARPAEAVVARVVNADAMPQDGSRPRLNLGCGHLPIEGFVNVDMRELPGVDVVAAVDALPFEPGEVGEIFSAHVLEHFPQVALERQLLPYWFSLLAPGGAFRAIVPDIDAMIDQYRRGDITFENLRSVAYGGQEYEGDFHHTAFTPESIIELLAKVGFEGAELVERGRPNGDCLEFEVVARRPA